MNRMNALDWYTTLSLAILFALFAWIAVLQWRHNRRMRAIRQESERVRREAEARREREAVASTLRWRDPPADALDGFRDKVRQDAERHRQAIHEMAGRRVAPRYDLYQKPTYGPHAAAPSAPPPRRYEEISDPWPGMQEAAAVSFAPPAYEPQVCAAPAPTSAPAIESGGGGDFGGGGADASWGDSSDSSTTSASSND